MIPWKAGSAVFAVLSAVSGCSDTTDQRETGSVRDSAGIAIIEAPAYALQQVRFKVADTPSVKIGTAEGAEQDQLFQVRGVRGLSDGSIVVLNAGTFELRRYDGNGRWINSSGGRGEGPGEMEFPVLLYGIGADTSLVLDFGRRGFHVVDPQGRIVRMRANPTLLSGFVGLLDSTTAVIAEPKFPRGAYNTLSTAEVTIATVDLLTSRRDTLQILKGFQEYRYTRGELVRSVPIPFTIMPPVGVRAGEIYVTDGHTPDIRIYDRRGDLRRIIRLPLAATPVSAAEWDEAVRVILEARARMATGEARLAPDEVSRQRAIYRDIQKPLTKPIIRAINMSDPNYIWARVFTSPSHDQLWIRLTPEGQVAATVLVSPRLYVHEITSEWVLGQEVDQLEVESVVRYPLRRAD